MMMIREIASDIISGNFGLFLTCFSSVSLDLSQYIGNERL